MISLKTQSYKQHLQLRQITKQIALKRCQSVDWQLSDMSNCEKKIEFWQNLQTVKPLKDVRMQECDRVVPQEPANTLLENNAE